MFFVGFTWLYHIGFIITYYTIRFIRSCSMNIAPCLHVSIFCPGVYRAHNHLVHKASRSWKKRSSSSSSSKTLVTLDHLWWRIRDHLDGYLEVADSEVRHIQRSFVALSDYENCQAAIFGSHFWEAAIEVNLRTPRDIKRVFLDSDGIHWMIHQFAVDGIPHYSSRQGLPRWGGFGGESMASNLSRFMVKPPRNSPFLTVKDVFFSPPIWRFPKIGVPPQSSNLMGFSLYKPSIWGYPYLWKPPYV